MGKEEIKVLHIDTENSWRGGQQQAVYLMEGMLNLGFETCMVCQPDSAMELYCANNHLPYHSIRFTHEFDYKAGIALSTFSKRFKADILQLHTGHAVSWGLWAELFNQSLKLVATRRVDFSIKKNFLSPFKYKSRNLDHIVCISEFIRSVMIKDGIPETKLSVIYSGVDIHKFDKTTTSSDFRAAWNIPQDAIIVGTIAAFAGHKDYPNYIRAASLVINKRSDVYFLAIGDGELLNEMQQLVKSLGIEHNFIFTGFQNDVGVFLKSIDIFVLASKKEGLGTTVLDALSVGLPVICTKAGGIPEMINDLENGILVPPQDSVALANAIELLLTKPDLRTELGNNAIRLVDKFDINNTINEYIKLYSRLLGV